MAVVVEHVARALGGTEGQLYAMFKQLWRYDPEVLSMLRRTDVTHYARKPDMLRDWLSLKDNIESLQAQGSAGRVVADLVMAHRIRGGVHTTLPEEDHFELERLFVSMMRAAACTFAEVRRKGLSKPGTDTDRQTEHAPSGTAGDFGERVA